MHLKGFSCHDGAFKWQIRAFSSSSDSTRSLLPFFGGVFIASMGRAVNDVMLHCPFEERPEHGEGVALLYRPVV